MKDIKILLNAYSNKKHPAGWGNGLGTLDKLPAKHYKRLDDINDDSYFILPISCAGFSFPIFEFI